MGYYKANENVISLDQGSELSLNKISIAQFEEFILLAGFAIIYRIPSETMGRWFPFLLNYKRFKNKIIGSPIYVLRKNNPD